MIMSNNLTWNYRIIKDKDSYYIAEVFYMGKKIKGWSEPILGHYESRKELLKDFDRIVKDTKQITLEVDGDTLKPTKDDMNSDNTE